MHFKKIETIQDTMYRYSNFAPDEINGIRKLGARTDEGWYVSFDKANNANAARNLFQLPPGSTGKFRLEFESLIIKNKAYVPYGAQMKSAIKEPVARDFANHGTGGGTQLLVRDQDITLKAVYEEINGSYVKIWPTN